MRYSPYIEGPVIPIMLADNFCRTIVRYDEMKSKEKNEMSMERWWNEICGRGKRKNPREKPTQAPFHPP